MKAMLKRWHKWMFVFCLLIDLQCGDSKTSSIGDKTFKLTTGKKHHDRRKEGFKEKRFTIADSPKGRVVYAYVSDRNRYVRPRKHHLYRTYIIRRPSSFRPRTESAVERQNIPYLAMPPTYQHVELPRARLITSQPMFYYQDQPSLEAQGLDEFDEPFSQDEQTLQDVPQEYSGTLRKENVKNCKV